MTHPLRALALGAALLAGVTAAVLQAPGIQARPFGESGATLSLLDTLLPGDKALTEVAPISPAAEGAFVLKTPVDCVFPSVPVPVRAATAGIPLNDRLFHVAYPLAEGSPYRLDGDGTPYWEGPLGRVAGVLLDDDGLPVYQDPDGAGPRQPQGVSTLAPPDYLAVLDLRAFVNTGAEGVTNWALDTLAVSRSVYGLSGDAGGASLYYDLQNTLEDRLFFAVSVQDAAVDADDNALPDDLYDVVGAGEMWHSGSETGLEDLEGFAMLRGASVVRLDVFDPDTADDSFLVSPRPDILVSLPSAPRLSAAGVVTEQEEVLAVVTAADDPAGLLDEADGDPSPDARTAWAQGLLDGLGAMPLPLPAVGVTLLARSGADIRVLGDISPLSVTVTWLSAELPEETDVDAVRLAELPVALVNGRFEDLPEAPAALVADPPLLDGATGALQADLDGFSVFLPVEAPRHTLTVSPAAEGRVSVLPAAPAGGYVYGTEVTLTATADTGFAFAGWTGDLEGVLDNPATLVIDGDKEVGVLFEDIRTLDIISVTPSEAWLFGGITARIEGVKFTPTTTFSIGGQTVRAVNLSPDGTSVEVLVPPSADRSANATVLAAVTARDGAVTAPTPVSFQYRRFVTDASGRNLTAFILGDPASENTVKLTAGGGSLEKVVLTLPPLAAAPSPLYGLGLTRKIGAAAKAADPSIPDGQLASSLISGAAAGAAVEGSYDFSLHLFADPDASATIPPPGAGGNYYIEVTNSLLRFPRETDAAGAPAGPALRAALSLADTGLTYADARSGLSLWGLSSGMNYVTAAETCDQPITAALQSQLLAAELSPALTAASPDANAPESAAARIYEGNAFSLRRGASLPAAAAAAVALVRVDGAPAVTGKGSRKGGNVLTLYSPQGGLGYVDRVELRESGGAEGGAGGVADASLFVGEPGDREHYFEFRTPKSKKTGIVDIVVYLKSNPAVAAAVIPRAFEYRAATVDATFAVLALLGMVVAVVGISAGTDAGGWGFGGPCFIATAAYGTPLAAQVDTLRAVRDVYLLDNPLGTAFVDLYYHLSPAVADRVAAHPALAVCVRLALAPMIVAGRLLLAFHIPTAAVMAAALLVLAVLWRRRRAAVRARAARS
ncbi:MAG TPA: hypothetical protein PKN23_04445 [Candidatus Hydrogenedentes bacterium]|nr:hypothetical protein [Candidatus Hydrogenedentota bacterium]